MNKIQKIFNNFLTSGIEGTYEKSDVRRAMLINFFSLFAVFSLSVFLIKGLLDQKWIYATVIAVFWIFTVGNLILLRKTKKVGMPGNAVVVLMFLLILALIAKLGEGQTGLLWFYVYPMLAFFILGRKEGLIYTVALGLVAILYFKFAPSSLTVYNPEMKSRFLFTYFIVSGMTYVFEMIRAKTYKSLIETNEQKTYYLSRTLQQKEEIIVQAEKLELTNKELEKLSIVASETNNAVVIMDPTGKFEWVNPGFTRLYGYSLEQIEQNGFSIFEKSTNPEVKHVIQNCIEEQESCSYEAFSKSDKGEQIWVQTTLTPIVGEDGKVSKLIAIDSDISMLKKAQEEIKQQNEEILAQKEELEYQNQRIERQNKNIHASIRYAQTIQSTILPDQQKISKYLKYFLIFRPKDVVSGDFYWFSHVENNNQNISFLAVVDCTGHGVPGAFMSLIGNRILNDLVNEKNIYDPAQILEQLDTEVRKTLKQKESDNRDGMDVCLVKIEHFKTNHKLTYSGAKRPLFYVDHKNPLQLEKLNADRRSIGGLTSISNIIFTNQEMFIYSKDLLYLSSDGFIDQNDFDRNRFGSQRLNEILSAVIDQPLNMQKSILEAVLDQYQLNTEQRDDITFWGVQVP